MSEDTFPESADSITIFCVQCCHLSQFNLHSGDHTDNAASAAWKIATCPQCKSPNIRRYSISSNIGGVR
jgi:hypothetical protein